MGKRIRDREEAVRSGAESAEPALRIRLLGPWEVQLHGQPLRPLRSRKGQWLLASLVLNQGRAVARDWLAGLLWPESSESQGLYNLRRNLSDLRDALGPEAHRLRDPAPFTVALDLTAAPVDLLDFDAAITRGDLASLAAAVRLYRGPLLEGCTEEWIAPERMAREQAYLKALETLAAEARVRGEFDTAAGYLRRAVAVDPLRESAQCALMEALAVGGDHAAATLVFREFRHLLHREVNAAPGPAITALFERCRVPGRSETASTHSPDPPRQRAARERNGRHAPRLVLPALPHPVSSFIGREQELEEIRAALAGARLVTLTGPGGVGKTRMALRVSAQVQPEYPDGVWFVDLAALTSPALVPRAIASSLGVSEQPGRSVIESLRQALLPRHALLVLDNCEHLLATCAELVAALLSDCPRLRILATSRQSLGITGEVAWPLPGLSVPPPQAVQALRSTPEALLQFEAVQLFMERARGAATSFTLTGCTAPGVVQICRRLDGLPLAIELAAARLKALSVHEIAARLDDRFRLLTSGSRTALPRQQTLRATMDWSYDLLEEAERVLLRRLSVFAGSWTLEAVEAVYLQPADVLDLLTRLVDRSLVLVEVARGPGTEGSSTRYRLLETVREYAAMQLAAEEEREVRHRHARYYLAWAEAITAEMPDAKEPEGLNYLEREHDNLRAAVDWAVAQRDREVGLRLGAALSRFWNVHGYWSEGRERLNAVLALESDQGRAEPPAGSIGCPPADLPLHLLPAQARALTEAAVLALQQHDEPAARCLLEQALSAGRRVGDQAGVARCCVELGNMARRREEFGTAHALLTEGEQRYRALDDRIGITLSLYHLGLLAEDEDDFPTATARCEECLALAREHGQTHFVTLALEALGRIAYRSRDPSRAKVFMAESLAISREMGNRGGIAHELLMLGSVARLEGEYALAAEYHREGLDLYRELGAPDSVGGSLAALASALSFQEEHEQAALLFREALAINQKLGSLRRIAYCLEGLAGVAARTPARPGERPEASLERAARLFGAAETVRKEVKSPPWPADQADYERNLAVLRAGLEKAALAAAWKEGSELSLQQAISLAMDGGEALVT